MEMNSSRARALLVTLLGLALSAGRSEAAQTAAESPDARKARIAWFHEAKFGLFIHWGLYAIPAGEWKGQRIPGIGEWIMIRA